MSFPEIPLYTHTGVKWCDDEADNDKTVSRKDLPKFDSLDAHTQTQLLHVIEQGAYYRMRPSDREVRLFILYQLLYYFLNIYLI